MNHYSAGGGYYDDETSSDVKQLIITVSQENYWDLLRHSSHL